MQELQTFITKQEQFWNNTTSDTIVLSPIQTRPDKGQEAINVKDYILQTKELVLNFLAKQKDVIALTEKKQCTLDNQITVLKKNNDLLITAQNEGHKGLNKWAKLLLIALSITIVSALTLTIIQLSIFTVAPFIVSIVLPAIILSGLALSLGVGIVFVKQIKRWSLNDNKNTETFDNYSLQLAQKEKEAFFDQLKQKHGKISNVYSALFMDKRRDKHEQVQADTAVLKPFINNLDTLIKVCFPHKI